ncbi:MAG: dihydropyrimidinase [Eubacteriales bacterium]|nr:dihydropyrimidinase [Eubacteriales bacterium]
MKTKLIKNGKLISPQGSKTADIYIEGEKISRIGKNLLPETGIETDTEVIDAAGKLIFPGFIDAHTHFDLHVAGTVTCDDFASGTKAAIAGGTTTIIDFGTQYHGETLREGLFNWHRKAAAGCSCDYSYHMSISEWNETVAEECQTMMDEGISTFKLYMTYDDMLLQDKQLFEVLQRLKEVGGITGVHCENAGMIDALREEYASDPLRRSQVSSHYLTRPAAAEAEAIGRLLHLCEVAGCDVIDVHLSCEEGLREIRAARARGQRVYVETCPHYLLLDHTSLDTADFSGAKYVCAPPLRTRHDQDVLWQALADGEIQTVSTDHCSFTWEQRLLGKDDFRRIPGGLAGVEYRIPLLYSEGVAKGRITAERMCEVCAENPAKLYGLYPKKGVIAEGSDADLVILNPNETRVLSSKTQVSHCDYCNYEGLSVHGVLDAVLLRGEVAAVRGKVIAENRGRFLRRGAYAL